MDPDELRRLVGEVLETGVYPDTTRFTAADTRQLLYELGQCQRQLISQKDLIAELREQERELSLAFERAEGTKSDFLSNMSHEIRTPLNGVMGMIQLARMKTGESRVREYLDYASGSAGRLLDLINDLLDLTRIEAGNQESDIRPLCLQEIVDSCVDPYLDKARDKGIGLQYTIGRDVPDSLSGDGGHLRQVLVNLVDNAVKFTEQGRVDINVERVTGTGDEKIPISFQVQDSGIGISGERLGMIFQSFEQAGLSAHAKYGGTGLGLAVSKRLVELMGGELQAESREGLGSTFSFRLPFDPAETSCREPGAPVEERPRGRPRRILVAEDNQLNQIYIMDLLESLGHSAELARNGREAIEKLAAGTFDLVLMDICMPEMNGDEAIQVIRKEPPPGVDANIPVIALSAHALQDRIDSCLRSGFNAYLKKPVDIKMLEDILSGV